MSKLNSLGIFVEAKERYEQEVKAAQTSREGFLPDSGPRDRVGWHL